MSTLIQIDKEAPAQITSIKESNGKTIVALTSSHLNEFQLCPTRYNYSMVQNLRMLSESQPLSRGSFMHKVLEYYYLLKREKSMDHGQMVQKAIVEARYFAIQENIDSATVIEVLNRLEGYFKKYAADGWEPLAVEQSFSKILYESDKLLVLFEGKIDLIVRNLNGSIVPVDHKSEKRRSEPIRILNQPSGYCWALDTDRFIYNKIGFQQKIDENTYRRPEIHIPIEKRLEWRDDTIYWVHAILASKEKNLWPKNRTACDKYGKCPYLPICDAEDAHRSAIMQMSYTIGKVHDPMGEVGENDGS